MLMLLKLLPGGCILHDVCMVQQYTRRCSHKAITHGRMPSAMSRSGSWMLRSCAARLSGQLLAWWSGVGPERGGSALCKESSELGGQGLERLWRPAGRSALRLAGPALRDGIRVFCMLLWRLIGSLLGRVQVRRVTVHTGLDRWAVCRLHSCSSVWGGCVSQLRHPAGDPVWGPVPVARMRLLHVLVGDRCWQTGPSQIVAGLAVCLMQADPCSVQAGMAWAMMGLAVHLSRAPVGRDVLHGWGWLQLSAHGLVLPLLQPLRLLGRAPAVQRLGLQSLREGPVLGTRGLSVCMALLEVLLCLRWLCVGWAVMLSSCSQARDSC